MRHSALVPLEPEEIAAFVDLERGTVAGRAFADDLVYDIELERVFARAWCFLCDAERLTAPGQFVSTFTGEDPVTVVRQTDGTSKVMLNSCRHRGLPVCGPAGEAQRLICGYHGWTYDLDGRLVGVLDGDEDFRRWAQDRRLALIPITRTMEVGGLLFGTWDAGWAPSLEADGSALADAIGAVRAAGPLERLPKPVRLDENWKVAVESLGAVAQSEDGVTLFPSFVALPSRGLVAAVHPKGPHACEVAALGVRAGTVRRERSSPLRDRNGTGTEGSENRRAQPEASRCRRSMGARRRTCRSHGLRDTSMLGRLQSCTARGSSTWSTTVRWQG